MIPLLSGYGADDPVLLAGWSDALDVSASRFCGEAVRLARTLPRARFAINRCEDPARFLLGAAAALMAGQTLLLPPARAEDVQRALRARFADAYALVDRPCADAADVAVPEIDAGGEKQWPPPSIDDAHIAAMLFTSGSTDTPTTHAKTWRSLTRGAATFAATFGPIPRNVAIVGTVAAQHMFGFETTALVPLHAGAPLVAARPLFPADVDAVLRRVASRGRRPWLVTTPLHLRTFHEALRHTAAARVIVSTMPMPVALARDVERDWDVEVHEIYGCTEGGMLAARRPAGDPRFVPAGNVRFELDTDGAARVSGGHVDAPIDVADRFERDAESGRLALIGRSADLVKIAGKRSSLAELSAILQSIPGVRDGAYLAPDPDAERVAAIVVAPLHDAASLRHALALRMDRVFLPRPLVFAAVLPRDAQGKVARAAMLALLREHRAAARPDRDLTRELCIDASHPSLPGHFPGHPLVPGVVLLERVEAMLREHGARVVAFPSVKFSRPVLPGEAFSLRVEIADNTSGRFTIAGARGLAASGTLQVEARS